MGESVNVSYLGTWIVAKGVGWPHDGLVVHQSRLSHHHGSHVRRLTGKKKSGKNYEIFSELIFNFIRANQQANAGCGWTDGQIHRGDLK